MSSVPDAVGAVGADGACGIEMAIRNEMQAGSKENIWRN